MKLASVAPVVFKLSAHARDRMSARRVSLLDLELVLSHGRMRYLRGARIFALGRKEVLNHRAERRALQRLEGLQIVTSLDGTIMTVYKNRDFRTLRPGRWRRRVRRSGRFQSLGCSTASFER